MCILREHKHKYKEYRVGNKQAPAQVDKVTSQG
jgi:hypothetical protein